MPDPRWEEIERALRREPRVDPEAVGRVMERVRAEPAHAPGRLARAWRWLTRSRPVEVSPLGALAGAAAVLLLALLTPELRRAPAAAPGPLAATRAAADSVYTVQFVLVAPEASRVSLVGDFNDWSADATPLRRNPATGIWTAVVPLRSGRYLYAFLVDGARLVPDADAARGPDDEFGGARSVVLVGERT